MKQILILLLLLPGLATAQLTTIDLYRLPNAVSGDNSVSKSTNSISANEDRPSGFYTTTDNTNLPNTAGWFFQGMRVRYAVNATPGATWAWDFVANVDNGKVYSRIFDARIPAWTAYSQLHDQKYFPVKLGASWASNDVLVYSTTTSQFENLTPTAFKTALGFGSAANSASTAFMAASNGKLVPTITATFPTTSGFSSTTYTTVVATGTLIDGTIYNVKAILNISGTDGVVQTWDVAISGTSSGSSGTLPDITNTDVSTFAITPARYFKLRRVKPASGNATFGLEASCATSDMVSASGTVTFTITPMH